MNELMNYPTTGGVGCQAEPVGIKQRLERAKAHHERELNKVNAALDALTNQPQVAELLETVMKAL